MLGSLILYLKGMRIVMFQLSGLCYIDPFKGHVSDVGLPLRLHHQRALPPTLQRGGDKRGFSVQGLGVEGEGP